MVNKIRKQKYTRENINENVCRPVENSGSMISLKVKMNAIMAVFTIKLICTLVLKSRLKNSYTFFHAVSSLGGAHQAIRLSAMFKVIRTTRMMKK